MKFTCSLFIHGNHCYTVRQRLHVERARILNLGFLRVKVYNFFFLNLDKKSYQCVRGMCIFHNPLFYTKFVAYLDKKIQTEF